MLTYELSEISATELEDYCVPYKNIKVQKHLKTSHHRQKRKKEDPSDVVVRHKEHKKKNNRGKKKPGPKVIETSEESEDDEYRKRRKKLADAVVVNKNNNNNDKTSLSERLQRMLCGVNPEPMKFILTEHTTDAHIVTKKIESLPDCSPISSQNTLDNILSSNTLDVTEDIKTQNEIIDICTDDESKAVIETVDVVMKEVPHETDIEKILEVSEKPEKDSDDDLELLRQDALKTKTVKIKQVQDNETVSVENKILSEDEDSDTTELRLICLKSALLKKAIEMKRKQKLQKKLSNSANLQDESLDQLILGDKINSDNNTDIESVDMDIGSDGDDKAKENDSNGAKDKADEQTNMEKSIPVLMVTKEDELEEDEDLLRAKLLTSLSKNLPNLINPNVVKAVTKDSVKDTVVITPKPPSPNVPNVVPEEKRFIINVESDSEGEHEATKNLTKMHIKLSEQKDFQLKLDMFLKTARREVEKTTALPDIVQQPVPQKKNEKYVAKAVKNLPKSEQIEYKNLVKRMAELEKIKQARQSSMNLANKVSVPLKDTLKPRNVTIDASNLSTINSLEEKIKMSRKNIAEESAKMLKLKEEGVKLTQKFKIVATELRNIKTAITLNKKQQRSVQTCLTKIRLHHQMLLKSSLTSTHSKANTISHLNNINPRLQKENNPNDHKTPMTLKEIPKDNYKNPAMLKAIKVGVTNDFKQANVEKPKPVVIHHPRLSIEIDVANNKKVVTMPDAEDQKDKSKESKTEDLIESKRHSSHPVVEKGGGTKDKVIREPKTKDKDDYTSPLDAFDKNTWEEDPNAILCPFEVCGDCKDADCKYLHTKTRSK